MVIAIKAISDITLCVDVLNTFCIKVRLRLHVRRLKLPFNKGTGKY